MEVFYTIVIVFLIIISIWGLVVGVANDAVNFLNSAIGSKVAPMFVIMLVASLGVVIGATFSNGMMEIARNGMFHPEKFTFEEVVVIFMGVIMANVILLDLFNTFGLPTSSTVSIVFGLLGSAVGVAMYKLLSQGMNMSELASYINSSKTLAIVSGILLSVIIAFTVGLIVQYIVRYIFTFNYQVTYKYFGSIFGGILVSAILFFMIIKGAKDTSFMKPEYLDWINNHTLILLLSVFAVFTILFQFLIMFFKTNIFPALILVGTFALAFAFAGNDLVNFIGVPLAGLDSYQTWIHSNTSADSLYMTSLLETVKTPTFILLISGLIMALTISFSKKAKKVIETSINLSRQGSNGQDDEKFESTFLARSIVNAGLQIGRSFDYLLPSSMKQVGKKRFRRKVTRDPEERNLPFDQVRASVNLLAASVLIAIATSLKLPLSTTYVTFMVAMGTSLADGAWDRETAVFRISGVVTVIGGWFFTAFIAFLLACIVSLAIAYGGVIAMVLFAILTVLMLVSTQAHNKKAEKESAQLEKKYELLNANVLTDRVIYNYITNTSASVLENVSKFYSGTIHGLITQDKKELKTINHDVLDLLTQTKHEKNNVYKTISKLNEESMESAQFFIQIVDYMREVTLCLRYISQPVMEYLDNMHSPLIEEQSSELAILQVELSDFFKLAIFVCVNSRYDSLDNLQNQKDVVLEHMDKIQKRQIKLIKKEKITTRNSLLNLNLLRESRNMVLFSVNMLKCCRDLYKFSSSVSNNQNIKY